MADAEHQVDSNKTSEEKRDKLVMEQLPQVKYIARRIHERLPRHILIEDLIHAGILGLLDAASKFDAEKQVQFQSYAKFRIRGAILDSLRDLDWSPRDLRRKARAMEAAAQRISTELGRPAEEQEVADQLDMTLQEYREAVREIGGLPVASLQDGLASEGMGEEREIVVESHEESPLQVFLREENRDVLVRAIEQLPERERQVLALYYFEELTMKEVGAVLGVGESRVSQIHSQALRRLRTRMQSHAPIPRPTQGEVQWTSY